MFVRVRGAGLAAAQPPGMIPLPADGVAAPESVTRGVFERPGLRSRHGGYVAPGYVFFLPARSVEWPRVEFASV